tara:strand:- start:788 stop:1057 length:270 start_codon:yes stop_codon:yes gene_type:complete
MLTQEEIEDKVNLILNHDWFYMYSDDHRVWERGEANSKRLSALCNEDIAFKEIHRMYSSEVGAAITGKRKANYPTREQLMITYEYYMEE